MRAALRALGRRVRELRLARSLTQERCAELAQLDAKHFGTIEAGQSNATVATLVAIAAALRVSLRDLLPA